MEILTDVRIQDIQMRARKGHRDWVLWKGKDGVYRAARYCAAALKQAMLAQGTRGRFYTIDSCGASHIIREWGMATLMLRNARYLG